MKILDLNLLLYAVNRDSPHHRKVVDWFDSVLSGEEAVGLAWIVLLGFLRISTRPGAFARPLEPREAFSLVTGWLSRPCVVQIHPGPRHWETLQGLLEQAGTAGNLTTDAHLAALACEYNGLLCSTDHDFVRFGKTVRVFNPLAA